MEQYTFKHFALYGDKIDTMIRNLQGSQLEEMIRSVNQHIALQPQNQDTLDQLNVFAKEFQTRMTELQSVEDSDFENALQKLNAIYEQLQNELAEWKTIDKQLLVATTQALQFTPAIKRVEIHTKPDSQASGQGVLVTTIEEVPLGMNFARIAEQVQSMNVSLEKITSLLHSIQFILSKLQQSLHGNNKEDYLKEIVPATEAVIAAFSHEIATLKEAISFDATIQLNESEYIVTDEKLKEFISVAESLQTTFEYNSTYTEAKINEIVEEFAQFLQRYARESSARKIASPLQIELTKYSSQFPEGATCSFVDEPMFTYIHVVEWLCEEGSAQFLTENNPIMKYIVDDDMIMSLRYAYEFTPNKVSVTVTPVMTDGINLDSSDLDWCYLHGERLADLPEYDGTFESLQKVIEDYGFCTPDKYGEFEAFTYTFEYQL